MKVINRVTEQVIEVTPEHFEGVLIKNGWDELVSPTGVQSYLDSGGFKKIIVATKKAPTRAKKATTKRKTK